VHTVILERAQAQPRSAVAARWLLALLCLSSAALLVVLGSRLSFFNDDWWFLLQRPGLESHGGLDTVLAPHNGNLVVLQAALYKAMTATFGLGSQVPFHAVIGIGAICLGLLVWAIVTPRLGSVIGLCAAALVMFLGPAWEALLFFGSSSHLAALVFGLGALVALERASPARDALACVLLLLAISVVNGGIAFVAGALIAVLLRRRLASLWIVAVPAVVFGLWWAFYGHTEPSHVSLQHIEHLPRYVFDSASFGLAAVTGLEHQSLPHVLASGHILTVISLALLILWLARGGRPSRWALVVASALLAFWVLAGASAIPGRGPDSSRYQVTDAVLLIVLAAELLRRQREYAVARWPMAAATVAIVASNLIVLRHGYDFLRVESGYANADLGALQIARPLAPPHLRLVAAVARDPYLNAVSASRYFAVTAAHGAPPVYSATQILGAPAPQRRAADSVLVWAFGMVGQSPGGVRSVRACSRLGANGTEKAIRSPGVLIENVGPVPLVVGVAHFAPRGMPVYIRLLAENASARVRVPVDSPRIPWRITAINPARARPAAMRVCQLLG